MPLPPDAPPLDLTDRAAFAAVVRTYQTPLAHYALRFTRSASVAADVVQDVFLTLWERRDRIDAGPAFRSLLYTMVRNRALNRLRNDRPLATDAAPEALEETPGDAPAADDALDAADLGERILRWIGTLPPRRAEAFMLSRDQGLSHAEIADVMGLSVRTVETHVFHALKGLRAHIETLRRDASASPGSP